MGPAGLDQYVRSGYLKLQPSTGTAKLLAWKPLFPAVLVNSVAFAAVVLGVWTLGAFVIAKR